MDGIRWSLVAVLWFTLTPDLARVAVLDRSPRDTTRFADRVIRPKPPIILSGLPRPGREIIAGEITRR